ncbi:hypothetical protein DFP93_12640 [Aneurinibacillus soli]|uniref:Uncharacterized protein n=1 Tax=Aneurinibacillus soli TaxID=1500254 RepID=A0A0U5B4N8_9BACL|nr:hypothetical protein DFP93_12640 [Aneurinibacillus soli]BAU25964.1 hypothetical protein CB4_00015 [Aneurinibacillus soli]
MVESSHGFDFIVPKSSNLSVGDTFIVGEWKGNKCVRKCGSPGRIPFQNITIVEPSRHSHHVLAGLFLSSPLKTTARYRIEAVIGECCVGKTLYQKFRCVRVKRIQRRHNRRPSYIGEE